jgi:bile acid-coenzyme A ligase
MAESRSYGAQLRHWAASRPSSLAVSVIDSTDGETSLTFGQLARRAASLARRLAAAGVGPDDMVPVCLPNSPEVFTALFGVWMVGACPTPLRHDMPDAERVRLLGLLKPKALIGDWGGAALRISAAELRDEAPDAQPLPELGDMIPRRMWAIGSGGSTGAPKLIVSLRPASVEGRFAVMLEDDGPTADQVCQVVCGPLYHTHALALSLGSLMTGDRIVVLQKFDAAEALRAIQRHRASMVGLVATMLMRVLRTPDLASYDLSSLKLVLAGAGAIPPAVAERWIDLVGPDRFLVGYGSSEGAGATLIGGAELLKKPASVGRAFECDIRILDERGRICPAGEIGEIYLRSHAGKTFEYLGAPEPPATDDGFTSIGDLGWLDDEGYLYIAERRTDMVKTGGVNVFPAEVEACLIQHPDVADVAVIGLPDPEWGRRLHAVIVPTSPARPPSAEALTAFCKAQLSPTKAPKTYEFVESLPRNDAMKLNRSLLTEERARSLSGSAGVVER